MKAITKYSACLVREKEVPYEKKILNSIDVFDMARTFGYENFAEEVVGLFCTDSTGNVAGYFEVARGFATECFVHPREIFKRACQVNAVGIILVHNHPSGEPDPSDEDVRLTERISDAGNIMGIRLIDHIVVGAGRYTSMRDSGLMPE